MNTNNFKLTPSYCLYNGVVIKEQHGSEIKFLLEKIGDERLKKSLEKAFINHIESLNSKNNVLIDKNKIQISYDPCNRKEIRKYVSTLYGKNDFTKNEIIKEEKKENEAAAILLLEDIILEAVYFNATDIHIEENIVKFRIGGILQNKKEIQKEKMEEVVRRIKLLSGMNVMEKRICQNGHFVFGEKKSIFIRASTVGIISENLMNTAESVVLRILDTSRLPLEIERLGFSTIQVEKIRNISSMRNGLVLVCGPTGAGKSTTIASILSEIARNNSYKIISLEDPPEYLIKGVTQIEIDENINRTFDKVLQNVFRQDPDVIMIGEIRNKDEASVAVKASLTGHLVFATLHASSAESAVLRLEELGIPLKLITSILKGIIVQDLNHFMEDVNLVGCVSIPKVNFHEIINQDLSEIEMEKYFQNISNGKEILQKSFHLLDKKKSNGRLPYFASVEQKRKVVGNED